MSETPDNPKHPRQIRSFVKRQGRMTQGQSRALESLIPDYGVDHIEGKFDYAAIFGREAETVLEYLKGSKNTKGFADSLLKDPNFIQDLRSRIKRRFEETEEYQNLSKEGITDQEKLIIQQKIDRAVNLYLETGTFPPELILADGGRVGLAKSFPGTAGDAQDFAKMTSGDVMAAADTPKIDFDTLRARLPKEIGDDIVRLIATSPEALEDFATIQTQQDVNNFNMKYDVELILPAEA